MIDKAMTYLMLLGLGMACLTVASASEDVASQARFFSGQDGALIGSDREKLEVTAC